MNPLLRRPVVKHGINGWRVVFRGRSVYSFWKQVADVERKETKRYLEALYVLKLRPMMMAVNTKVGNILVLPVPSLPRPAG